MTSDTNTNPFEVDEDDDIFGPGNLCEDAVDEETVESNSSQPVPDNPQYNSQLEESAYFVSQSQNESRPSTSSGSNASTGSRDQSVDLFPSQKSNSPSLSPITDHSPSTSALTPFDFDDNDDFLSQVLIEIGNLSPERNCVEDMENVEMVQTLDTNSPDSYEHMTDDEICQHSPSPPANEKPVKRWNSSLNSENSPKKRLYRKFPGPAGLLPNLKPSEFSLLDSPSKSHPISQQIERILSDKGTLDSSQDSDQNSSQSQSVQSSQSDTSIFDKPSWCELRRRLGFDNAKENRSKDGILSDEFSSCLDAMNIDWILTKAKRFPAGLRIPFLVVALLEAPELLNAQTGKFKPPCVTLVDPSGSILAAMDVNFASAYAAHLHSGTSLALQNVGLLHLKRQLVLTITERNVILMTSSEEEEPMRNKSSHGSTERTTPDGVKVIRFCDFCPAKIMDSYGQLDSLRFGGVSEQSNIEKKPALFSTCSGQNSGSHYFQPALAVQSIEHGSEEVFGDEDEFFKALGDLDFLNDSEEF